MSSIDPTASGGTVRYAFRLLGPPSITDGDGLALPGLGAGKSLALLAYLAVREKARRDELIGLLWGDIPEDKARNAFRQSLHRVRSALGGALVPQLRDEVELRADGTLSIDRTAFVTAVREARWQDAVNAYSGDFLDGMATGESAFDRWADAERVRLRAQYRDALFAAARAAASDGRLRDALRLGEQLVAAAPFDEEAILFFLDSLVGAGHAGQALSVGQAFVARLHDELDLPAPATVRALVERLERHTRRRADERRLSSAGDDRPVRFVGREVELARLLAGVEQLRVERGTAHLIEGERGSGKTRLLDEFADRLRSLGGFTVLRGREPAGGLVPYAGVAEALRPLVRAPGVAGASRHLLAEAARLLPELRDDFDLPGVEPIEDETGRLRFFEGIAALVDAAAYERPVCILVDDVHNFSASSLELLTYLSHRLQASPVLLLFAVLDSAPPGVVERLHTLVVDRGGDVLTLEPLSDEEASELAASVATNASQSDTDRIVATAAGRPFTIIELARGDIASDTVDVGVATLRDVLWRRLHAASPSQRRLFFAASLLARNCSLRLLAAAAHLPEEAALDAAEALAGNGLLRKTGTTFAVAHDATSPFLVEASGLSGRALLAGWAADALAAEGDAAPAELAALYAAAGQSGPAFRHARRAAFSAASIGAHVEATRLLALALTFAPNVEAQREIESFLAIFGKGKLALPAVTATDGASATDERFDAAPADEPAPQRAATDQETQSREPRAKATARQWAFAVAISLVVILVGLAARRALLQRVPAVAPDTMVVSELDSRGLQQLWFVADANARGRPISAPQPFDHELSWTDSLRPPWTSSLASPDGRNIAVERMTEHGQDLYVIAKDRHDTTALATGGGDNLALGWSPDGRALLVSRSRTLADGSFDSDLYRISLGGGVSVPIDTASTRAVTEAKWSPSGLSIAWVARTGADHQRDVFVAHADGSDARDLSANASDDYHINWSSDGTLLVFTSTRSGASRLYVYDFENAHLWPVSDRAGEDYGMFSPDGRTLAFQAIRDGESGIFVRPALGGTPRRVTPIGRQFSITRWTGAGQDYVDRVRILGSTILSVGDSARLGLLVVSAHGKPLSKPAAVWTIGDSRIAARVAAQVAADSDSASQLNVIARAPGSTRVIASVDGWRADTVTLAISSIEGVHVLDNFSESTLSGRWIALGDPRSYIGAEPKGTMRSLYPNGDLEWDSGVLLREPVEVNTRLSIHARLFAPFSGRPSPARATIALVAARPESSIDHAAPQLTPLVGFVWDAAASQLTYVAGEQTASEPMSAFGASTLSRELEIDVRADHTIAFSVDGNVRWTAPLAALGAQASAATELWIGGRATGNQVAVGAVRLDALPPAAR